MKWYYHVACVFFWLGYFTAFLSGILGLVLMLDSGATAAVTAAHTAWAHASVTFMLTSGAFGSIRIFVAGIRELERKGK